MLPQVLQVLVVKVDALVVDKVVVVSVQQWRLLMVVVLAVSDDVLVAVGGRVGVVGAQSAQGSRGPCQVAPEIGDVTVRDGSRGAGLLAGVAGAVVDACLGVVFEGRRRGCSGRVGVGCGAAGGWRWRLCVVVGLMQLCLHFMFYFFYVHVMLRGQTDGCEKESRGPALPSGLG